MNLEQLRDALTYKFTKLGIKDRPPPSMLDLWINRGARRIAVDTLCLEDTNTIVPNGTSSSFILIGAETYNVSPGYIAMKSMDHSERSISLTDIDQIRNAEVNGEIIGGNPEYAAIFAGRVYFDRIPPATLTINVFYYKNATEMAVDTSTPDYPISLFENALLEAATIEYASDVGDEKLKQSRMVSYEYEKSRVVAFIENKGKHQRSAGVVPKWY